MADESATIGRAVVIEKFEKALHDRSAFSCGNSTIDNFFKITLSRAIKSGMVTTWVATKGGEPAVLGFYTLAAFCIAAKHGPKQWQHTTVPEIPCIFIPSIGVRKDTQSQGLGKALVFDAIRGLLRNSSRISDADREWPEYVPLNIKSDNISTDVLDSFSCNA